MVDAMIDVLDLPQVPPAKRSAQLRAWIAAQPSADEAARALSSDLATLLDEDDLAAFLNAEKLWMPLSSLAERVSGRAASTLWAWAASAASITGSWADHGASFACRAIASEPSDERAWTVFEQCVSEDSVDPVVWESLDEWLADPARRSPLATRALSVLERCAGHWIRPRDAERLAERRAIAARAERGY